VPRHAAAASSKGGDAGGERLTQSAREGRPRNGVDLARAAQERALRYGSPVLRSLIAAREARALSLMTDGKAAGKRLTEARRLVDRTGRGRPSPDWAAFHGHAELDYAQGLLHADFGRHHAAVQFIRAALAHQDRTYGRNRAIYRLTLAKGLVISGEVDEGAAHAVASLEHLEEVAGLLGDVGAVSAREAAQELSEYARTKGAA
jgi:hypothetical protein